MSIKILPAVLLSCLSLVLFSCKKASTEKLSETVSMDGMKKTIGNFYGTRGQEVSGQASIYLVNNKYQLQLENFHSSNGPDLKVYLSKASIPSEFISLGDIKSTNGNQVYDIPGTPDFTVYRYVLIHCERYNHLYGVAELK